MKFAFPTAAKLPEPASAGEEQAYVTTAAAGWWVARQRVPGAYGKNAAGEATHEPVVGHVLWLTPVAAQYEVAQGAIVLMAPQPKSRSASDIAAAIAAQSSTSAGAASTSAAAASTTSSSGAAPAASSASSS